MLEHKHQDTYDETFYMIYSTVHNLLSETLGTRHVSEIGIFRISEW
jgi:hypothetical protein